MRIFCTSDLHVDERSPRWDETTRVLAHMARRVQEERPSIALIPGDVYERQSTPNERLVAAEFLQAVAEQCTVCLCSGNHDAPHDLELLAALKSRHPIIVVERPRVVPFDFDGARLGVACVPWPRMAAAVEGDGGARDQLRALLTGLRGELETGGFATRILMGHFMCEGSLTSAGQPLTGGALNVSLGDLALANAHAVVMGHVHLAQEWMHGDVPMLYMGSPVAHDFGETGVKSFVWLDVGTGVSFTREPTGARQMLLVEGAWTDFGAERCLRVQALGLDVRDAEVRLRYAVPADEREPARREALSLRDRWLAEGAHSVKVEEEVVAEARARAPEIATAKTLAEKLFFLWRSRSQEPPAERAERLLGPRLAELEAAVQ